MSESDTSSDDSVPGRTEVWIEKYRPERLDEIKGHEDIIPRLKRYVERDDLPHLLFAGPAGTGKCVTGETPVLTNQGVKRIDGIVDPIDGFGRPPADIEVLTYTADGTFEYVEPSYVYSARTDEVRTIRTEGGNEITSTPEHRYLVCSDDGFTWRRADSIEPDEQLVRPGHLPRPQNADQSWLEWPKRDEMHAFDIEIHRSSLASIEAATEVPNEPVDRSGDQTDVVRVSGREIDRCHIDPSDVLDAAVSISLADTGDVIAFPSELTPSVARVAGLLIGSGTVTNESVTFSHPDCACRRAFKRAITSAFDVEANETASCVTVSNATLCRYLRNVFPLCFNDAKSSKAVSTLPIETEANRRAFLSGVVDGSNIRTLEDRIVLPVSDGDRQTVVLYICTSLGLSAMRESDTISIRLGEGADPSTVDIRDTDQLPAPSTLLGGMDPDTVSAMAASICDRLDIPRTDPAVAPIIHHGRNTISTTVFDRFVDRLIREVASEGGDSPEPMSSPSPGQHGQNGILVDGGRLESATSHSGDSTRARATGIRASTVETDESDGAVTDATVSDAAVLRTIECLDGLRSGTIRLESVESVERDNSSTRVYDLTVPSTRNYVAGPVPTVVHNTTAAQAIAREIYAENWNEHFLELNASDERGIDVVRDRIKTFARSSFGGFDYRIIFLDEADALTSDAQSALRRTMEQFSNNTRFILSCNYSSQIIDPIQSRCAAFRFTGLNDDAIEAQIREIAEAEGITLSDGGVDAIVYAAAGDMRKAINGLQAAAVMDDTIDEDTVYTITTTARPEEVQEMVELAVTGDFAAARSRLDSLLSDRGLAGGDVIDQLHRSAWDFDLSERETVRLLERLGETDYRITEGANERLQLEAFLASLSLESNA